MFLIKNVSVNHSIIYSSTLSYFTVACWTYAQLRKLMFKSLKYIFCI